MPLCCFTVALLFLAFVGSMVVIVFSAMKSTDVYKEALARGKARSTCRQTSHSADGIIRGWLWKSDKRMNASIFVKGRRRPIHFDFLRCKARQKSFPSAQFFSESRGELSVSPPDYFSASLSGRPWRASFMFLRSKAAPGIL